MSEIKKEDILFEDETMKIYVIPNLLQIVIECKDNNSYETYKSIMTMIPSMQTMIKSMMDIE